MTPSWTLDEGRAFAQKMERAFACLPDEKRCHIALGGGVLHRGSSEKDLDIIIYPRKKPKDVAWDWAAAAVFIEAQLGVTLTAHAAKLTFVTFYIDEKRVMFADLKDGKRVDFFFLS